MPFTPFHMGAAMLAKPVATRNFSVLAFGIAQVAMDMEPGLGMIFGWSVLHGPSHTILGALLIACLVVWVSLKICTPILQRFNREARHYGQEWLCEPEGLSRTALVTGAFFGTLSHLILDSLMHHDIRPLSPFTLENPLQDLVSHDGVYQLCLVAGVIGTAFWLVMKWKGRPGQVEVKFPQDQNVEESKNFGSVWVRDLWLTWSLTILFSALPAVLFGTGLFAIAVLMLSVLIGLPVFAISQATSNKDRMKRLRKLLVVLAVPILTMVYVFKADARIPTNAAPITQAIEAFKADTGRYPETLEELIPKYLPEIPELKPVLIQPTVRYKLRDGAPSLSIPSAAGDAFAEYEYDFVNKTWIHHS